MSDLTASSKMKGKYAPYSTGNKEVDEKISELVKGWNLEGDISNYIELVMTVYKLAQQHPSRADLILLTRTFKELRHANKVFAPFQNVRKIAIFGSARTLAGTPEYEVARQFAKLMQESKYMIMTGGGDGIMGAAQAGAGAESSFGLNIKLPFEQRSNETIAGDPKLMTFRYFFTRKLTFIKESHALALFPGGFGTMDEGFEAMTLLQTGKKILIPVVMIDAPRGNFWKTFEHYLREHLLRDQLISPADFNLIKITDNLEVARKEVLNFYYNFHSYRFVADTLVIRLQRPVPEGALKRMQDDFADIMVEGGKMLACGALEQEINEPELSHLPRLCLNFNRHSYGRLRQLIDRVNEF
jgi:uncharacterized protein (TIGR00730 family)